MDPFEVRMQFIGQLKKLTASQQSIQKTVGFALKYFSRSGEDLWDCIIEECQKGSINTKINILYMLDSLCEACLASRKQTEPSNGLYVDYVAKDLHKIVDLVVPDGRTGLLNLMSATQVLENWRVKRIVDPVIVTEALDSLNSRKERIHNLPTANEHFPTHEARKRIEEDRERHKRLRERRWVQPVTHVPFPPRLASFYPLPASTSSPQTASAEANEKQQLRSASKELAIDMEFETAWETTSDWNEDDDEAVQEENALCFPESTSFIKNSSTSEDMQEAMMDAMIP